MLTSLARFPGALLPCSTSFFAFSVRSPNFFRVSFPASPQSEYSGPETASGFERAFGRPRWGLRARPRRGSERLLADFRLAHRHE